MISLKGLTMRKALVLLPLLAFLVVVSVYAKPRPSHPTTVYFAPTEKAQLSKAIIRQIEGASIEIRIALYTITHDAIVEALVKVSETKQVRLILDRDYFEDSKKYSGEDVKALENSEVNIRWAEFPKDEEFTPRFHHKFAVFDEHTVITGSYNWTWTGESKNYENMLVINDRHIAKQYGDEFERLWKKFEE
jgi:phosphatidylserine/phosphatidylglycerophosphate/cardiolipin synthase-like enzyme